MADLQTQLAAELLVATKNRDTVRVSTLRMLISAFRYKEVEKRKSLSEGEQLEVVQSEAKRRKEAVEQYTNAGRADLAAKEQAEYDILAAYLPQPLSMAEIQSLARAAIQSAGAKSPSDLGRVMGILMPQIKGRADGKQAQNVVKELLS